MELEQVTQPIKEVKKEPNFEKTLLKDNPYDENYKFLIKRKDGYKFMLYTIKYPTNNCQLSSIGNANDLLQIPEGDIVEVIHAIRKGTCNMVIMDIRDSYLVKLKKFFEPFGEFRLESPYKSSNGSSMVILILKWNI